MTKIRTRRVEPVLIYIPHLRSDSSWDGRGRYLFGVDDYEGEVADYKVGMVVKINSAYLIEEKYEVRFSKIKAEAVLSVERKFFYWYDYLKLIEVNSEGEIPSYPYRERVRAATIEIPIEGINRNFLYHGFILAITVGNILLCLLLKQKAKNKQK